jgi:hypothetical protein
VCACAASKGQEGQRGSLSAAQRVGPCGPSEARCVGQARGANLIQPIHFSSCCFSLPLLPLLLPPHPHPPPPLHNLIVLQFTSSFIPSIFISPLLFPGHESRGGAGCIRFARPSFGPHFLLPRLRVTHRVGDGSCSSAVAAPPPSQWSRLAAPRSAGTSLAVFERPRNRAL